MKWIKTEDVEPTNENSLYWVFNGESVIQARFNDYKSWGGDMNWWQDMSHNDFSMTNTSYIEFKKPEPPGIIQMCGRGSSKTPLILRKHND